MLKKITSVWFVLAGLLFSGANQAAIINPFPGTFGADDGAEIFSHTDQTLAVELGDATQSLANVNGSFGFYFEGDSSNRFTIFDHLDFGSTNPGTNTAIAVIDFSLGRVFDVDEGNTVQTIFSGIGNIGFFFLLEDQITTLGLFTQAALNPGGLDMTASFPALLDTSTYLLGFELTNGIESETIAFEVVQGIQKVTAIDEPATLLLAVAGLMAFGAARRGRKNAGI